VADGIGNGSVDDKSLGDLVSQISENASTLVREEIELARAEIEQKVRRLAVGTGVGAAAGFFLFFTLVFLLEALAWGLNDIFDSVWIGFLVTAGILLVLAGIAGFVASRLFKAGAPPTPDLAIEEAKLIRESLEHLETEAGAAATTPKP
jgi:Putative Actinobacterial Holin-X, holin superfamily III